MISSRENISGYLLDEEKCVGCGLCVKVCPGGLFSINGSGKPKMKKVHEFGWNGCWKCQRCMAVCPEGAVSILGKKPENSISPADPREASVAIDKLIANRRSCRRYLNKNVDAELLDGILHTLQNAPTGGSKHKVEYTLIDDKDKMNWFRNMAYRKMEEQAKQGIFPEEFDQKSYDQMKEWEQTVRPDMLFCGAPHLLIPHAPLGSGCPVQDVNIAGAYFELLCASRGLGAVYMTFPLAVLGTMPEIKALLGIPDNHYIGMIIGFGYPEIKYARGIQKQNPGSIHRCQFT